MKSISSTTKWMESVAPTNIEGRSLIAGVHNLHLFFCLIGVLKTVGVVILGPETIKGSSSQDQR